MGMKFLRERQIRQDYLPIGHATFWKWVRDGILPPGRVLSPGVTVWLEDEILALGNRTPEQELVARLNLPGDRVKKLEKRLLERMETPELSLKKLASKTIDRE